MWLTCDRPDDGQPLRRNLNPVLSKEVSLIGDHGNDY